MKNKKLISSILLCAVLTGCSGSVKSPADYTYDGYVSPLRTGVMAQGFSYESKGNDFECTETGTYFMCHKAVTWLLYVDHGSDTVIKLCGRPDCDHMNLECNALFKHAENICFYDGFLYTYNDNTFGYGGSLVRINPDGSERTEVYDVTPFMKAEGYTSVNSTKIYNGIFIFTLQKIDTKGETTYGTYYYKLDGSMEKPIQDESVDFRGDGEAIIGNTYDSETKLYTYGIWEPEKGIVKELLTSEEFAHSYIGVKAEYTIEDGVIVQNSYTEGKKELFDTGLKGNYWLNCYPDFLEIHEYLPYDENSDARIEEPLLYFFGWDGNDLGSVKIDYEHNIGLGGDVICGETEDRIMLLDEVFSAPRYYINKSDFGIGNIEIHEFNKLDLGTSGVSYKDGKIEWF